MAEDHHGLVTKWSTSSSDEELMEADSPVGDSVAGVSGSDDQGRRGAKENYYEDPNYPTLPKPDSNDWEYVMRRTMQEILPGLFLGPYASATRAKLPDMINAGLTHVICVRQYLERNLIRPNHVDHFKYLVVELCDTAHESIIPHMRSVTAFIDSCLEAGGRVLVHGNAGISRSAALVIGYVMYKFGISAKESYRFVQTKRFCVNPNEGFMAQLSEYEPICHAMRVVPPVDMRELTQPAGRNSTKRGLELEEEEGNGHSSQAVFPRPLSQAPTRESDETGEADSMDIPLNNGQ